MDEVNGFIEQAKERRLAGDYQAAVAFYRRVLAAGADGYARSLAEISIAGLTEKVEKAGERERIAAEERAAVGQIPDVQEAGMVARAARQAGNFVLAEHAHERAVEVARSRGDLKVAYNSWAATARIAKQSTRAVELARLSIQAVPEADNEAGCSVLLGALCDVGDLDEAVRVADRIDAANRDDPYVLNAAARAYRLAASHLRDLAMATRSEDCYRKAMMHETPTRDSLGELELLAGVYRALGAEDRATALEAWARRLSGS